jgi:hypothetical protein
MAIARQHDYQEIVFREEGHDSSPLASDFCHRPMAGRLASIDQPRLW